jgi:hypothetical protein
VRLSASRPAAWPGAVLYATAGLSLLAALIHMLVTPEHFEEWWGYGAFILACAIFQGVYAAVVLRWPARPVLLLGVASNLAVAILWLVTRATGIPLFGPHAGEIEGVGVLDLACTLAEAGVVVGLAALAMRGLETQGRLQIVVAFAASGLLFWHLLHLLAATSAH